VHLDTPNLILAAGAVGGAIFFFLLRSLLAPSKPEPAAPASKKKTKKSASRGIVVEEHEVVAASPSSSGGAKKKKKKKPKKKAATSVDKPKETAKPVAVKEAITVEEDSDSEDDFDPTLLLTKKQLAKVGATSVLALSTSTENGTGDKKKKKKKKKKGDNQLSAEEPVGSDWSTIPTKAATDSTNVNVDSSTADPTKPIEPHTITLNLQSDDVPTLIGPKGSTIQALQTMSGAKLDIDKTPSANNIVKLNITGLQHEIDHALEEVQSILNAAAEERRRATAHSATLNAADINGSDGVKAIIGRGGVTIQSIQSSTGTNINASVERAEVLITGPSEESVDEAVKLCRNAVFGECQEIIELGSRGMVNVIYGKDYVKINGFQRNSGAKLDIERGSDILKISGSRESVNTAVADVEAWMEHCKGLTVEIESSKIGAVFGKGGANIRSIQDRTGTFIEMEEKSDKPTTRCTILGEPDAVKEAKILFDKSVDGEVELKPGEVQDSMELGVGTPAVIGRKGAKIMELERTFAVKIRVKSDSESCTIIGKKAHVDSAKTAIGAIIAPLIEAAKIQAEADKLAETGNSAWHGVPSNGNGWVQPEEETGW